MSSIVRPSRSRITRLTAGLAAEPLVERELEAFLAHVVDVGEAEQVSGHFAGRVVAAVLAQRVDARNSERLDLGGVGCGRMWRTR